MAHSNSGTWQSLVDVLRQHVAQRGDQIVYTFLADGETEHGHLTFADLDRRARAIAAELTARGLAGQRALMLYHPGLEFITAFLGCLYAGTIAVPAYPPASKRHWPRLQSIVADSTPHVALTASAELSKIQRVGNKLDGLADLPWWTTDTADDSLADTWQPSPLGPESLAFLQYTSGSTSTPKGVMVSHGNLMHNEELIRRGFGLDGDSVIVGWLPLYHDMGLIGNLLQPLYLGARLVFMAPVAFLQKPVRWLRAIARYGAGTSGGPNFAYDLCCQRITAEQLEGLDLSCWQVAFSGAEPVRAETLDRFARMFADYGFQSRAFYPCYGMAETTLMTTGGDPTAPPVVQSFDARALESDNAVLLDDADQETARRLVGSGHRGWQLDVVIADPASRRRLAEGRVGEIWVSGESVAQGYWQRPEVTAENFRARLADEPDAGPYLRTGDLGFFAGDELFITGRAKDLIILRGRNHYPQDIERTAEESHGDLRPGCGAAVSIDLEGEERLVVIYEVERRPKDAPEVIAEAVRRRVSEVHEVQVHDVVLIRVATVPKTSSGKIQRHACRRDYLDGNLTVVGNSRLQIREEPSVDGEILLDGDVLRATDAADRDALLQTFLKDRVARLAKIPRSGITVDTPLTGLGLDSLTSVQLTHDIEERLGLAVSLESLLDGASLRQLSAQLLEALAGNAPASQFEIATTSATHYGLSSGQRALWYLHQLDPQSAAYHISGAARFDGSFDLAALQHGVDTLVRRHAALRTTFAATDGTPRAQVHPDLRVEIATEDVAELRAEAVRQRLTDAAERPFDLATGPLLRVVVLRGHANDHLLLVLHHIVGDFWSLAILLRELAQIYRGHRAGTQPTLVPVEATYADFVAHQEQQLAADGERLWGHWQEELAGELPILDLPTDRPRPALQTFRGALAHRTFDPATQQALRQLAQGHGVTLYMLLLSLYQIMLSRFSGQADVLVGSPFTLRSHPALAPLVGYFVNPLVLRGRLHRDVPFENFLEQTRQQVLSAFAHRDLPFPVLSERLALPHDPSRSPVFQTLFVLQRDRPGEEGVAALSLGQGGAPLPFGEHTLEAVELGRRSAQFDLTLQVADTGDSLQASFEYNADLFDPATIDRFLDGLMRLAEGAVEAPQRRLSELPLLSPAERRQILHGWRTPPLDDADGDHCLHHLVLRQARKTPDEIAVAWYPEDEPPQRWTYRRLDERSADIAARLRSMGAGPSTRVAICSRRRPELIVGLLAILRCGATYVPLDPAYPGARLEFILEDSQASVLLMHEQLPDSLAGSSLPRLDMAAMDSAPAASGSPDESLNADHLAYLIYTSGSTGRPKGVAISHRSAVTLIRWSRREFSAAQLAKVLAATSVCFDLSVYEIFLPLAVGGQVVVAEHALELPRLPEEAGVTLVNTVPSAMAQLAGNLPESVETVNLAGEPLVRSLVDRIYAQPSVRGVYNLYGPSEDTTYSTWVRVPADSAEEPTIGRPIAATHEYLVDRHGALTPRGVAGELLLGGDGLAQGYFGRPALTAEKFIPDPFSDVPGARVYRTGDLVRHRADGEMEFLGRLDHQVKIRGFRIELGEIEKALEEHSAVEHSVVVAKTVHDEPALVAYLAVDAEPPETSELRSFLGANLPAYMVPQAFVQLPELPLTPNGKIDRKALPEPQWAAGQDEFVAPSTVVEEILAEIWQEVLGVERIGIHDSFFELGGHSLLATRVLSRVQESFGVDLPIRSLLESPTLLGLSEAIAEQLLAETDEDTLAALMAEMDETDG